MLLSAGSAGVAALVAGFEISPERGPDVHLLEGGGGERLVVEGGALDGHAPELRQDLGWGHGSSCGYDLVNLLHDAVPELQGAEAVELVLGLLKADEDAGGFVLGGLGSGGERGVPGLKTL